MAVVKNEAGRKVGGGGGVTALDIYPILGLLDVLVRISIAVIKRHYQKEERVYFII